MNKRIDLSNLGGFPLDEDALDFMQTSYRGALAAIAQSYGDKTIVSGVVVTGTNVSDGWIVYNGELIPFTGGLIGTGIIVQETSTTATFQDGNVRNVFYTKTAFFGTPQTFPFSDLKRINTLNQTWVKGDIKEVDCDAAYIAANFDATGLGRNERLGWAVCNGSNGTKNRGGRVSVALQYPAITVDPNNNVWDVIYNTIGSTGGERKHTLDLTEIPDHTHSTPVATSAVGGSAGGRTDSFGPPAPTGTINEKPNPGVTTAHENRQPFIVSLFIQKL